MSLLDLVGITAPQQGQAQQPRCTTDHDDRRIVHRAAMDHAVTSQTITQRIQSVPHHSWSVRNIRHRLQQNRITSLVCLFCSIESQKSIAHAYRMTYPGNTAAATPDKLWQFVESYRIVLVPQGYIHSFLILGREVCQQL
ncbi:hypothetical protein TNCV_3538791 [Trichonephila clavipes]|nr:hypothetical protein TNCV_3538791 [Trichonephila clavipes]